jgi:hypothetical protein
MRQWRRVSFWFVAFALTMLSLVMCGTLAVVLRVPK